MKKIDHTPKLAFLIILLLAGLTLGSPVWAVDYTITDLGTMGRIYSIAHGINNSGLVVGEACNLIGNDTPPCHAFLYNNGAMTDIGTLISPFGPYMFVSLINATGINNSGQVVGTAWTDVGGGCTTYRAFLYSNGAMTDLGSLGSWSSLCPGYSSGSAINDNGQVVGESFLNSITGDYYDMRVFLYSNGSMVNIGALGGINIIATGINNSGQVVGYGDIPNFGGLRAFLYSNGVMTVIANDSTFSIANGINDSGQVVGMACYLMGTYTQCHAFLYSNGAMTDLGAWSYMSSVANSINKSGQVVGYSYTYVGDNLVTHAFLYNGGSLLDLNNLLPSGSGWILTDATSINDLGQIVGNGVINGHEHAFLMTPVNSCSVQVTREGQADFEVG